MYFAEYSEKQYKRKVSVMNGHTVTLVRISPLTFKSAMQSMYLRFSFGS